MSVQDEIIVVMPVLLYTQESGVMQPALLDQLLMFSTLMRESIN
jgi:hypothetical protein